MTGEQDAKGKQDADGLAREVRDVPLLGVGSVADIAGCGGCGGPGGDGRVYGELSVAKSSVGGNCGCGHGYAFANDEDSAEVEWSGGRERERKGRSRSRSQFCMHTPLKIELDQEQALAPQAGGIKDK